jgi:predicted DNA binding protein
MLGIMAVRPYLVYMRPHKSTLAELSKIPGLDILVLGITHEGGKTKTLAYSLTPKKEKYARKFAEILHKEDVLNLKILTKNRSSLTFILEKDTCDFYEYTLGSGIFILFPYLIKNGVRRFYIFSEEDQKVLLENLKKRGDVVRFEGAQTYEAIIDSYKLILQANIFSSLTPLQREVISRAIIRGYFDWPRRSSLTDLAKELGVSKATLAEHIRRSEAKILSYLLDVDGKSTKYENTSS